MKHTHYKLTEGIATCFVLFSKICISDYVFFISRYMELYFNVKHFVYAYCDASSYDSISLNPNVHVGGQAGALAPPLFHKPC